MFLASITLPIITATNVVPATASMESSNLLVGDHASFDLSTGGWVGSSATVAHVTSPTQAGPGALAVTAAASGNAGAISGNGPTTWTPAQPGQVYTGSAWTEAATTGRSVDALLGFISSAGTLTNTVWGQAAPDTTTGWTQTVPVVGIAPPGTAYVELAVVFYGAGQGETHYVDTASLTTHSSGSSDISGPLHTFGNHIVDATNAPVTLRGVTNDWLDWNSSVYPGASIDDNSVAHMKLWGANVVRVLLSESYWNSTDCHFVPSYAATVDQVVNSITSRGMVAMLDLHNNGRTSCENSMQQRMADYPGSVSFWQSVASRYQSNARVAFDLYNEPHDISWAQWLNGGQLTDPDGVTWQAAGMQQLYGAVRGTGAQNLVFVSGDAWGNSPPPSTSLLAGYNIVYAAHYYTCPGQPPPTCTTPDPYNPAPSGQRLDAWSPLAGSNPVMITEFGWPDPASGTYNQNVINWAESKGIGWTPYAFFQGGAAGTTSSFGFLADQTVYEPAASGMPILTGLAGPQPTSVVPNCTTFFSPATGSHQVCGAIRDKYLALGGPTSFLGYPTTDDTTTPDGIGHFNHFSSTDDPNNVDGSIYWTASTGAWSVHGAIRDRWDSLGSERSCLGYPVSDEFAIPGGRQSKFQHGTIMWNATSGLATWNCQAAPYHPLTPARITDTRSNSGQTNAGKTLGPGSTLNVQVAGAGGVPSTGVSAAVLNVTVTNPTAPSFLTVWPTGAAMPNASNLNFVAGQTVPNLVEVGLGSNGQVSIGNNAGSTDVVVDVEGYVGASTSAGTGLYNPLTPARITDTRSRSGQANAGKTLGAGSTLNVQATGVGGVPATGVSAVVLNVTVTNPTAPSVLIVWPTGASMPLASNLNYVAGQTVPNRVMVPVGTGGQVSIYNNAGNTDVVVDVGGYFTDASNPSATGSQFTPTTPARITDTRSNSGQTNSGKTLGPGSTLTVQVAGAGGVPASGVTAAVLNVTVTNPTASSVLTVWPNGAAMPLASDLNWVSGETVPNLVVVKLGSNGTISIWNNAGNVDVIVDVSGWYS